MPAHHVKAKSSLIKPSNSYLPESIVEYYGQQSYSKLMEKNQHLKRSEAPQQQLPVIAKNSSNEVGVQLLPYLPKSVLLNKHVKPKGRVYVDMVPGEIMDYINQKRT
jgi:hypothetical protein